MELGEYLKMQEDQEVAMQEACYKVAIENKHTIEEADLCDNLSVGCVGCPFVGGANTQNLTLRAPDSDIQKSSLQTCEWTFSDHPEYFYNTACGHAWQFTEGLLEDNKPVAFCPYCGKRISS